MRYGWVWRYGHPFHSGNLKQTIFSWTSIDDHIQMWATYLSFAYGSCGCGFPTFEPKVDQTYPPVIEQWFAGNSSTIFPWQNTSVILQVCWISQPDDDFYDFTVCLTHLRLWRSCLFHDFRHPWRRLRKPARATLRRLVGARHRGFMDCAKVLSRRGRWWIVASKMPSDRCSIHLSACSVIQPVVGWYWRWRNSKDTWEACWTKWSNSRTQMHITFETRISVHIPTVIIVLLPLLPYHCRLWSVKWGVWEV